MRQFACEWCGPAMLTIGGTLQSALPRNELRITASLWVSRISPGIWSDYPYSRDSATARALLGASPPRTESNLTGPRVPADPSGVPFGAERLRLLSPPG